MKLLIVTQVVDTKHPILGFFHRWIIEFAKHCEEVHVIALKVGEYDLPENVVVHSLGKEDNVGRLEYVYRFYTYVWRYRKEYDHVFVHMNQVYVLLGWIFWKLWGKEVLLWYMHKSVTLSLRIAHMLVDGVVTASEKSFRIESKKKYVVGHGIDTETFMVVPKEEKGELSVLSVGRIAPVKQIDRIIDAVCIVPDTYLSIVGGPGTKEDERYMKGLEKRCSKKVSFLGPKTQQELPVLYQKSDVCINMSNTGSIDKVVLEAMSTGTLVITTNEAFEGMFSALSYTAYSSEDGVVGALQEIKQLSLEERTSNGALLRSIVEKEHSLAKLIPKILRIYEK